TEFDTTAFTTGSGTNEPTGIITALDGTASELSPATAETFAVADVYSTENSLPPRYRGAASAAFMMNRATINDIRQFASDDGH
ncbi:phage major capsid protein, partial [Enterococcus hirae]